MTMTDPIADFLTRIRNATRSHFDTVDIPSSKMKLRLAKILKEEGYINDVNVLDDGINGLLHIELKWMDPRTNAITVLQRESRPSRRCYVDSQSLPCVRNGHGVAIISTSRGLMTDAKAREMGVGGEFVCSVY